MPCPLEYMDLTDNAVVWEIVSSDRNGMPLISSPEEIDVRWEEAQNETLDANGQKIVTDVQIASKQNLQIGSLIWEGSLEDLADEVGSALIPTKNIYEIIYRIRAKDLKGCIATRYEFACKRFKDRLAKQA